MRATDLLKEEHEIILRGLGVLQALASRATRGEPVPQAAVEEVLAFLTGFADTHHHHKEEEILFPAMEAAGFPRHAGPLGVMLHEHVQGRGFIAAMRDSAPNVNADSAQRALFAQAAQRYIELLSAHIGKENQVLFHLAEQAIPREEQRRVDEAFEQFEQDAAANRVKFESSVVRLSRDLA